MIQHKTQLKQNIKQIWPAQQNNSWLYIPYRINPLGAHVDHQGGNVLARTIELGTLLAFRPFSEPTVRLTFCPPTPPQHEVSFAIGERTSATNWQKYAEAAAVGLNNLRPLSVGLQGAVAGSLLGAGLSSSASVLLAYLRALAQVNGFTLSHTEQVELVRRAEQAQLGLDNGVQDQMSIVYGQPNSVVHLDVLQRKATIIPDPTSAAAEVGWLLVYSGFSRELLGSGFNSRVAESREAASRLHEGAIVLDDVPQNKRDEAHLNTLPSHLARRARHFFGETDRVAQGKLAWQAGDWGQFGQLMNQSCASSIHQYESGSTPLITLQNIMSNQRSVYGSRFCGGGYGGCLIALVDKAKIEAVMSTILTNYLAIYPEKEKIATAMIL